MVLLHRELSTIKFAKKWSIQTCESCGEDFSIKQASLYRMGKSAYCAGTKAALLCLPCRTKSIAEVSKAKISLAKIADLEKAIELLEKTGRQKAADILKKQLVEAKRG